MTAREARDNTLRRAVVLLAFAAGCQAPPARPAACDRDAHLPRRLIVTRQVLADTAVYTAQHPRRSARTVLTEPPAHMRDLTVGTVEKCRAGRPAGPLPSPDPCRPTLDAAALEAELAAETGEPLRPAAVALQ